MAKFWEKSISKVKMWTDGGSRGNPGEAAIGIIIQSDQEGKPLYVEGRYLGSQISNNQAEYQALYYGLNQALQIGVSQIICHLDSQLVVEQINGRYKVKDAGLKLWWDKIQQLRQKFDSVEVVYVPRAQNAQADKLVNQALDNALYNKSR